MKKTLTVSLLFLVAILSAGTGGPINPLIGDQSYILKYGKVPNEFTPDQDRIAAHLEYAEYVLRSKDVSGMSAEQIQKRTHLLDLLHDYWTRGIFPRNDDVVNERRPCFIDRSGTICAVGYLVEQTAGHDVAELINERFMYNEILDMKDPVVLNWIQECGLTEQECAIIQPNYGYARPKNQHFISYGVSYKVNDFFYHSFRYHFEKPPHRSYRVNQMTAFGAQVDLLRDHNFSAGILYGRRWGRGPKWLLQGMSWVTVMPEYFYCNGHSGANLRPGFEYRIGQKRLFASAAYTYAIPVVNENWYDHERHEFSVRVGIKLNGMKMPKLPKIPKKPKKDEQPKDGAAWNGL